MACPAGAVPNPSFDFFECACARFGLHVPTMILVYFNLNQPAHWHILSAVDGKPIIHLLLHASIPFFLSHLQFGTCYQHPSPLQLKVMEMDYSCVHCSWSNDCKRTFFPTMTKKRWEGRARKQNVVRACYCPSVQKPPVHPTWLALVRICPQHFHGKIPHQSHQTYAFSIYVVSCLCIIYIIFIIISISIIIIIQFVYFSFTWDAYVDSLLGPRPCLGCLCRGMPKFSCASWPEAGSKRTVQHTIPQPAVTVQIGSQTMPNRRFCLVGVLTVLLLHVESLIVLHAHQLKQVAFSETVSYVLIFLG